MLQLSRAKPGNPASIYILLTWLKALAGHLGYRSHDEERHARRCDDGRYELPQRGGGQWLRGLEIHSPTTVVVDSPWSRPADFARGEVLPFQHFTFGWHTLQVTEPAQSTLRQGDWDGVLFSLLSNSVVSYMVIPFDIFESALAAHGEGFQSIAITDSQVPCPRAI